MALSSPFIIHIERERDTSFGDVMNEIRSWLDHCRIEPASFKQVAVAERGVGFEIGFNSEAEARRFERDFA